MNKLFSFFIGVFIFMLFFIIILVSAFPPDNSQLVQNVSGCGTLNTTNAVYTLNQSITASGTCFIIGANNITINFNGFNITGDQTPSGPGVNVNGYNFTTIKNGTISYFWPGIYLLNDYNSTITNMTIFESISPNIKIENSVNALIRNNTLRCNNMQSCITLTASNNTIKNNYIDGENGNSDALRIDGNNNLIEDNRIVNQGAYGIYILGTSSHNIIKDTNISNSATYDIYADGASRINNTCLNCTYNITKESIASGSELIRKWYYRAYVNDTSGNPLNTVSVEAKNSLGTIIDTFTTDGTGYIPSGLSLIDYINSGGSISYYSNYTLTASKSGYSSSAHQLNITLTQNKINDYFTLSAGDSSPLVSLVSPSANYLNISSPVSVNFTCNATDDIALANISLYLTNSSQGNFNANQTTSITGISNSTNWTLNFGAGYYIWNCLAYDNISQSSFASVNRTLQLGGVFNVCYNFTQAGNYTLTENITNAATNCLVVSSNNVTLNLNGYIVDGTNAFGLHGVHNIGYNNTKIMNGYIQQFYHGIYMTSGSNSNITNMTFLNNDGYAIFSDANSTNNSLENIVVNSSAAPIHIEGDNNKIRNVYAWNCTNDVSEQACVDIFGANNSYIGGSITKGIGNGIRTSGDNNLFKDINISNITRKDVNIPSVLFTGNNQNHTFINVTYSTENVTSTGQLIRKWYYKANVNWSNGSQVSSGNVWAYNKTNALEFNATISSGTITTREITDYANNAGAKSYYSLYNITASSNPSSTHSFNASHGNNLTDIFIFDNTAPNATILTPANNSYLNNGTQNFTINVSDNNGLANATLYVYNQSGLYNQTTIALGGVLQASIGIVVNLVDGIYNWFWNIVDLANNAFNTATSSGAQGNFTTTVDTILPGVNIIYPANTTYTINVSALNYTYSDINANKCWYSRDSGVTNSSVVAAGINFTNVISVEGSNTWRVYCNDSAGNLNSSSVTFVKDTIIPNVTVAKNATSINLNNWIYANCTTSDNVALSSVLFNITNASGVLVAQNNTLNFSSIIYQAANGTGTYNISCFANDTSGNSNFTQTSFSVSDATLPTACYDATLANTVYAHQNSFNTTGTCINVLANNVTINMNGFNITGDGSPGDTGIYISTGINYTTVKNGLIDNFGRGIYNDQNRYSNFTNLTIDGTEGLTQDTFTAAGIFIDSGINNSISNVNIYDVVNPGYDGFGIFIQNSDNNTIVNSLISSSEYGIKILNTPRTRINNLTTTLSVWDGFEIDTSDNSILTNITSNNNGQYGLLILTSQNVVFTQGTINGSTGHAIFLQGATSDNNNFTNITITSTASGQRDLFFATSGIDGTYLIDMPNIKNYSFTGAGGKISVKTSLFGVIDYLVSVNGSGVNFTNDIRIGNNSVIVESTSNIGLNRSANITLYGIGNRGFNNPQILRNGVNICNSTTNPSCYNFTALNTSTVIFNVSSWTNYSIGEESDTTSPIIHLISPANNTATSTAAQTFSCNITDNIGIANLSLYIWNSTGSLNYTNTTSLTGLANLTNWTFTLPYNNAWKWNCLGYDTANNSNWSIEGNYTLTLDTISPAINFTSPTETSGITLFTRNNILINVTASDSGSGLKNITIFLYNSTGSLINSTNSITSPLFSNFTSLANGLYFFNATAYDNSGNLNNTETRNATISYDATNPLISITYPLNTTYTINVSALNYTVSDANLQACWYSLNLGVTNTTITCGTNATGLTSSEGSNTWRVYANDSAGNTNSSSVTFFKDTIIPNITLITPANLTITNQTSINFTANVSDANGLANATLNIYNQSGLYNQTTITLGGVLQASIGIVVNLVDGIYNWFYQIIDLAGNSANSQTTEGNRTLTIDTVASSIVINSPGNITYNNKTLLVNISSNGTNTWFNWNGTNQNYISPVYVNFAEGTNILYAYANDSAGNLNSTNVTFAIDTTAPTLSIISPLNQTYGNATVLINISSNGNNIWFNNDSGVNETYTSEIYRNFSEGTHTIYAYANDTLGNLNSTSVTFSVNTSLPSITIISPIATTYNNRTLLLNLSSNGQAIWYSWNGTNTTYTSSSYILFAEGNNTLYAYANNSLGLENSASVAFITDTTAPSISIISPQNTTYNYTNILVNISSNGSNIWYSWNGTNTTYTTPVNVTFNNGSNTLYAYANDTAGNLNTTSVTFFIFSDIDRDGIPDYADRLVYNESNVSSSGLTLLDIAINGTTNVDSDGWNGTFKMQFLDSGIEFMNFTHNFTINQFDLSKVSAEKTSLSIVVNLSGQLAAGEKKTLYIVDNSFVSLCVKDAEISSVSQISSGCNGINETDFASCLGNTGGVTINNINCYDEGARIRVENLTYSGIRGTQAAAPAPAAPSGVGGGGGCITNWSCGNWSLCVNNIQTRTCNKIKNYCYATNKLKEIRNCTLELKPTVPAVPEENITEVLGEIPSSPAPPHVFRRVYLIVGLGILIAGSLVALVVLIVKSIGKLLRRKKKIKKSIDYLD